MSKWPFAISDIDGGDDADKVLRNARAELEGWTWGVEGGTPAAEAALRQVSVDAAMVVVEQSLKFVQNERAYGGPGFMFEPGAEPVLTCWPIGTLETVQIDLDLEAAMLHHDIVVHEREQMTDMAACLRRIADRYEQAAEQIDWAAVAADRFSGVARPFDDGTIRPPGPLDEWAAEVEKTVRMEMLERLAADMPKEVLERLADMPAPKF